MANGNDPNHLLHWRMLIKRHVAASAVGNDKFAQAYARTIAYCTAPPRYESTDFRMGIQNEYRRTNFVDMIQRGYRIAFKVEIENSL